MYICYQIKHPRIQAKSVTFLKEEEFRKKFLLKLKGPKNESVYTNKGHLDTEVIKSIFKSRDADNDGYLKRSELENFIRDTFDNEEEHIFRQYALDEILRHFDKDSTQSLTMTEFEEGCTSWLNKWSVANKGLAFGSSYVEGRKIFDLQREQAELIITAAQSIYIPGSQYLPTKSNKRMKAIYQEINTIFQEVLRLYPPVVAMSRMVHNETKLGNITLPAGTLMQLHTMLLHHDRDIWGDDVKEFNPERFSQGVSKDYCNIIGSKFYCLP
nr:cytochrome P450 CYP72A219-like [Tanacetum cinerariifolium]